MAATLRCRCSHAPVLRLVTDERAGVTADVVPDRAPITLTKLQVDAGPALVVAARDAGLGTA